MAKQERLWHPKPHRAVSYNEKAIQKVIDKNGSVDVHLKVDGVRGLLFWDGEHTRFTTREGIEFKCFQYPSWQERLTRVHESFSPAEHLLLDVEVLLPEYDFDTASGLLRKHDILPVDTVVQLYFISCYDPGAITGSEATFFNWEPADAAGPTYIDFIDTYVQSVTSLEQIDDAFEFARRVGFEGLIIRDHTIPAKSGKVSGWWKYKPEITEDGIVCGFIDGTIGKQYEGKLVGFQVRLEDGDEIIRCDGFTDAFIEEVTADPNKFLGRYVEVKAMEKTKAGKLRHPKFNRLRDLDYMPGVKL